jgi:hypothetical protein
MAMFNIQGNLPSGIHVATWEETKTILAFNSHRQNLLQGLQEACKPLKLAGCTRIYLGGSFVTNKERPKDFDACWDDIHVNLAYLKSLEPVLLDFKNKRAAQKAKYGGELFPASYTADTQGKTFLEFFQQDRDGNPKGIIQINL